jgi:hypothetical protein
MYDIIFINNNSKYAQVSWNKLKQQYPRAKSADSFEQAQKIVFTKMFWVVWPDIDIADDFKFDYRADEYSQEYVHTFLNRDTYDGVILVPKRAEISERELRHRFFINKKEVDIVASTPKPFDLYYIDTWEDYEYALENSSTEMFWAVSHNLKYSLSYINNFYFSHHNSYDRKENHAFVHEVDGRKLYNGVFLCSQNKPLNKKQIDYRFLVNAKQWDDVVSGPRQYEIYAVTNYNDYLDIIDHCPTEMFWMIPSHVQVRDDFNFEMYFSHESEYDRKINHVFKNGEYYDGIILCSKHAPISEREFKYKFITNKKEHDVIASDALEYDKIVVNTYEEFCELGQKVSTDFFYVIPNDVDVDWDFNYHIPYYERENIHVFKNGKYHDGVFLIHKDKSLAQREFDYRFFVNKKEIDITVSTPKPYDIVFISYNEPNADDNYRLLTDRFPRAKRVHGVKGIHQAHIEAAKLCTTNMFFVVDGDAQVLEDFVFEHQVPKWQRDQVFVWRSRNPINDLEYGYGGIKLFPVRETLNMDVTKTDMTTSISPKFNAMESVSNITTFNTDAFSTWKSAFRECCKLASKTIRGQVDNETEERLKQWCEVGHDALYGKYAIHGACSGRNWGNDNKHYPDKLNLINDFDWLYEEFSKHTF